MAVIGGPSLPSSALSSAATRSFSSLMLHDEWWRSRVLLSVFVVLLHVLACVFYAAMAKLHVYIQHSPAAMIVMGYVSPVVFDYFDYVIAASIALVVVHGLGIGAILWLALPSRARRRVRAIGSSTNKDEVQSIRHPEHVTSRRVSVWKHLQATLAKWDHALERRCGIDSHELLVLVEIGLQTFQAYKLSQLVATVWINRLVVLVLVLNCWFMPAVSVAFRKKTPTFVRVVHLALDAVLEILYGMVVPLAIFYPYYRDAMAIFYDIPYIGYYSDTWSINAVAENRQIYVTSWLDFCSKMAPGVSLFVRLYALQAQRNAHEVRTKTASLVKIKPEAIKEAKHSSVLYTKRFLIAGMVLWGLAVLVLHLVATGIGVAHNDPGCLLELRPLGSTEYTCRVLEVSCTQKQIRGTASELDDALRRIDATKVRGLVFSHCEALTMPPRLKTFSFLAMIKIHNCTIAEWSDAAALTVHEHPAMQILYVTLTNMTAIPPGLLSPDFPPTLNDIEFCGTNLTALPVDLFETWPGVYYFFLELSPGITEFPLALQHSTASIPWLSISANAIPTLPDDLFETHEYEFFLASGNPLTQLPAQVGSAPSIGTLAVAHTAIADVPAAWTATTDAQVHAAAAAKSGFALIAGSTPLCSQLMAAPSMSADSLGGGNEDADTSVVDETLSWLQIQCGAGSLNQPYYYPLEHEKLWRLKNRS